MPQTATRKQLNLSPPPEVLARVERLAQEFSARPSGMALGLMTRGLADMERRLGIGSVADTDPYAAEHHHPGGSSAG